MKKKTRLLILSVIATLAFTSAFAACGKGGNDNGGSSNSSPISSEVVDGSSETSSDVVDGGSSDGTVTPATYAFTKVWDAKDRVNGSATTDLEAGAALDLSAPADVAGKVFVRWVYSDGTAVETDAVMGEEAVAIFAEWTITPYTVTVKEAGKEDVVYTFGVEADPTAETEIIDIQSIAWVIEGDYADTDTLDYTISGMPETWELKNYELEVTSATRKYAFTKVHNPMDRMNGATLSEVAVGDALDLSDPATVDGKVFEGWFYADGTAVAEDAVMGTEAVTIYAKWTVTPYTVTIKQAGVEDVVLTFGAESVPATETSAEIIDIKSIGWVITEQLYKSTDYVTYTFEGMPATAEDWKLENCEITVTATVNMASVIEAVVANGNKVTNGTLQFESDGYVVSDVTYELADGYAYLKNGDTEKWYIGYGEGKVLGLQDDNDGYGVYKSYYETAADMVNGYAFETVFDYTNTYYGVEEFVSAIYALADEKVEAYENGVYEFSLVYVNADSHTKYEVSVAFTLSDASVMETVEIQINSFYENIEENEDGYVYDEEGNPKYLGTYNETADSLRVYTITQATDGKVVVAYNPEEILVSSYTLKDAEGTEVSELDLVAGTPVELNIADVPETAVLNYETFTVTVVDADEIEVDSSVVNVYVNAYSNTVEFTAYADGEYTITIESAFVTKVLTASVTLPETTEIYAKANANAWSALTSTDIYDDGAVNFIVAANDYADASAEVVITTQPEGADASVEELDGEWTFYPDGVGEYVITITSIANEALTATITVNVKECPALETIFNGEYQNSDKAKDKQLYILMMQEDELTGQLLISLNKAMYGWDGSVEGMIQQYCVYMYAYDKDSRTFALTAFSEAEVVEAGINEMYPGYTYSETVLTSMQLTADYQLKVAYANDMTTLVPYAELTPAQWVAGDYAYEIDETNRYFLRVWDDGTASLTKEYWNEMWYGWAAESGVEFKYTIDDSYAIDITEITYGEMAGFTVDTTPVFNKDANTITVKIGDTEYVFA